VSFVVAIDGPAGAGKSTVAKAVAMEAGLSLVDTGAIYRTVALLSERAGTSWDDGAALATIARELPVRFELKGGKNVVHVSSSSGDEDVSEAIRAPSMSMGASAVSRHPQVRDALLDLQRRLGRDARGAVLEGRDIGTVVFPDARVKVYLTASAEERARRRSLELSEKGQAEPYDKVLAEIRARDDQDMSRAVAPLKPADDAVVVDTSDLSFQEVVARILDLVAAAR
jgi:CMP/dCMP kinase